MNIQSFSVWRIKYHMQRTLIFFLSIKKVLLRNRYVFIKFAFLRLSALSEQHWCFIGSLCDETLLLLLENHPCQTIRYPNRSLFEAKLR